MFNKNRQLKDKQAKQSLDVSKSYFCRLNNRIKWMKEKHKFSYIFLPLLLTVVIFGYYLNIDKQPGQSSGVVLGEYEVRVAADPTEVTLCANSEVVVTPSYESVEIGLCTQPDSICTVSLLDLATGQPAGQQSDNYSVVEHNFVFDNLISGHPYEYDIDCTKENLTPYEETGNFTTLQYSDLTISSVAKRDAGFNVVDISWSTSGGDNQQGGSDGKSDSRVYYRVAGGNGQWKIKNESVISHIVSLGQLNSNTEYEYYVKSVIDDRGDCSGPGQSTKTCATSGWQNFKTQASSGEAPDSNIILKVNRDRVCDSWLYCQAAVQMANYEKSPPQKEDICFSVGLCEQVDEGGNCVKIVDLATTELVYESSNVDKIKNLSGFSKVGFNWGKRCVNSGLVCKNNSDCGSEGGDLCKSAQSEGYYPYSAMKEVGLSVGIGNANFEEGSTRPWKSHGGAEIYNFSESHRINKALKITPSGTYSGAEAKLGVTIDTSQQQNYIISFWAKTDSRSSQKIKVNFGPYYDHTYYDFKDGSGNNELLLSGDWQEYIVSLNPGGISPKHDGRPLVLNFVKSFGNNDDFYIDEIRMKSVLEVAGAGNQQKFVARSCRMYPTNNASACDYYDEQSSRDYYGWKGYCVEPDPAFGDQYPVCLQWWPVDVISGEANIFSKDTVAGYVGRKPLYYCLESEGNYPYVDHKVHGSEKTKKRVETRWDDADDGWWGSIDVSEYNVYRDELINVKINGVDFDHDGDSWGDCNVKGACLTPSESYEEGETGTLIFNMKNKDYWDREFVDSCDNRSDPESDGKANSVNKYVAVRCGRSGDDDKNNVLSARLIFNSQTDLLEDIEIIYEDAGTNDGNAQFNSVTMTYRGETCNIIAMTIDPEGENKAWTKRIAQGGWTTSNDLDYKYETDYIPYGASVVPNTGRQADYDPTSWEDALYVEPPNDSAGMQAPYQIRAGSPYAVAVAQAFCEGGLNPGGNCSVDSDCAGGTVTGICVSYEVVYENSTVTNYGCKYDRTCNTVGSTGCYQEADFCAVFEEGEVNEGNKCVETSVPACKDDTTVDGDCSFSVANGKCKGSVLDTQCIVGNGDKLGSSCRNSSNCGFGSEGDSGMCIGIDLTNAQNEVITGGWRAGQERLSKLFAKSYGVWKWQWDNNPEEGEQRMKYVEVSQSGDLSDYGWDITNSGNEPKVDHILVNDTDEFDFEIIGSGTAVLKFSSWVDPNQLPLVSYSVDWGDGTKITESGLRIYGRSINTPHILVHHYKYNDSCGNYCEFSPTVSLIDNWGKEGGRSFSKSIIVYPPDDSLMEPTLSVEPTNTTYRHNVNNQYLPHTKGFEVTNSSPSGKDLIWTISEATGVIFSQDPPIHEFKSPHYVGYEGSLRPGESETFYLELTGIGNLSDNTPDGPQEYQGEIIITSNDPKKPTEIISVTLEFESP